MDFQRQVDDAITGFITTARLAGFTCLAKKLGGGRSKRATCSSECTTFGAPAASAKAGYPRQSDASARHSARGSL